MMIDIEAILRDLDLDPQSKALVLAQHKLNEARLANGATPGELLDDDENVQAILATYAERVLPAMQIIADAVTAFSAIQQSIVGSSPIDPIELKEQIRQVHFLPPPPPSPGDPQPS